MSADPTRPDGTTQGTNGFRRVGYGGPAPPPGRPHRYVFRLFAPDARLDAPPGADRDDVTAAMSNHVPGEGQLLGTYGRQVGFPKEQPTAVPPAF